MNANVSVLGNLKLKNAVRRIVGGSYARLGFSRRSLSPHVPCKVVRSISLFVCLPIYSLGAQKIEVAAIQPDYFVRRFWRKLPCHEIVTHTQRQFVPIAPSELCEN